MTSVLRSALLGAHGFAHGFSLRTGGVSAPPFGTLNLGRNVGDSPDAVEENARRFASAVGFAPPALFDVSQVHGSVVERVLPGDLPADLRPRTADALVTTVPGAAVGVRVADCVPVLLAHPGSGAVAAVHAGWRGVVARVLDAAVRVLCEATAARPEELVVALGPHIRVGAFEVAGEVAAQLAAQAHGATVIRRGPGKPHADLALTLGAQLRALGVPAGRVDDVGGCTYAEPARFFSFRRDGQRSGRHVAAIVARR